MTRIYLIRHAEAEGNFHRRAHGHHEGRITERGYQQMELLKKRFENEQIDIVYSSDLVRARTTSAALCEPRGLEPQLTERLREVSIGAWEDTAWDELAQLDQEQLQYFSNDPARWSVPGSEDYMQVRQRITDCVKEIGERHDGQTVAVFSHGFAIRAFTCEVLGIPSHETDKIPYCDNTAVALLIYEDGELRFEYRSDNSHLDDESSTFAHQSWWRENAEE